MKHLPLIVLLVRNLASIAGLIIAFLLIGNEHLYWIAFLAFSFLTHGKVIVVKHKVRGSAPSEREILEAVRKFNNKFDVHLSDKGLTIIDKPNE